MLRSGLGSGTAKTVWHTHVPRQHNNKACYTVRTLQAAQSLAEHASRNAGDAEYESPYTEEAIRSGMDLPWWQKIITTSLDFGELKLGKLTVSVQTRAWLNFQGQRRLR